MFATASPSEQFPSRASNRVLNLSCEKHGCGAQRNSEKNCLLRAGDAGGPCATALEQCLGRRCRKILLKSSGTRAAGNSATRRRRSPEFPAVGPQRERCGSGRWAGRFVDSALKGREHLSPGQSAAPPWVGMTVPGRSPERAKLLTAQRNWIVSAFVSPFQGLVVVTLFGQWRRGAAAAASLCPGLVC